jgi:subtilisin family serine protease
MLRREICAFVIAVATSLSTAAEVTTFADREIVPGAYAVFFKHDAAASDAKEIVADIEKRGYVRIEQRWETGIDGVLISNVDEATAKEIAETPGVESVTQDYVVKPSTMQFSAPVQLDRIDQAQLPLSGYFTYINTGSGVHAYVIDSAILTTHQDFQLNGVSRASNDVVLCPSGISCSGAAGVHGTEVASVLGGKLSGVAKQVRLHGVVITYNNESTSGALILSGLQWVSQHGLHPGVVNISYKLFYSASDPIAVAARNTTASLIASNFFISAPAGNGGENACDDAIGGTSGVFTVAGITESDQHVLDYVTGTESGKGPCVSAYAEFDAYGATKTSISAYAGVAGTSFSAPIASGIAALYWSKAPTASRSTVMSGIIGQTTVNVIGGVPPNTPNRLLRVWPGL